MLLLEKELPFNHGFVWCPSLFWGVYDLAIKSLLPEQRLEQGILPWRCLNPAKHEDLPCKILVYWRGDWIATRRRPDPVIVIKGVINNTSYPFIVPFIRLGYNSTCNWYWLTLSCFCRNHIKDLVLSKYFKVITRFLEGPKDLRLGGVFLGI